MHTLISKSIFFLTRPRILSPAHTPSPAHILHDGVAGGAPVHKKQVFVVVASVSEPLGVVESLVETDDGGDLVMTKVWEVELGGVERISCRALNEIILKKLLTLLNPALVVRPSKGQEFT